MQARAWDADDESVSLQEILLGRREHGLLKPAAASATSSASRLVAPITLAGCAALSVETCTNRAPTDAAARAVCQVPNTLVRMALSSARSAIVTCL